MIAAVATIYNEADIIETTVRHLFAEGVDRILVADASTDGTTDILLDLAQDLDLLIIRDTEDFHFQPKWINLLAERARTEWIIPFDADEFWYAPSGDTIAGELSTVPPGVTKVAARVYQHTDWDHKVRQPQPFPKVAYRWNQHMRVANGNHSVDGPGVLTWDPYLEIREWQFRSFEHLCDKSRDRTVRLDPSLPETEGTHQRVLYALDEAGKREAWEQLQSRETVFDPIPARQSYCTTDLGS